VLAVARRRGASRLLVLGDLVGYHAEPDACVALIAAWPHDAIAGNHDLAALGAVDRYANRIAAAAQRWTAEHLGDDARRFLAALPVRLALPWGLAVHANFTHPDAVVGYVTPVTAEANLARVVAAGAAHGWFGHSHVPALHVLGEPDRVGLAAGAIALPRGRATLFNPGSVGQPRDGDSRAAFALFDPERWTLELVRVAYDLDATARAVRAAGLDEEIIGRLRDAR
jgi:diadenosine tetraphosphatase ApaH/serine/threonine PP2A family protein phosphatase